ncbi:MAG TPA: ABC transporter substrate-binding protein [Streptosporangiaceae bacterium]|nr:ABC transporter substrate-binding protein [Streptosporangiaceae bacterium]
MALALLTFGLTACGTGSGGSSSTGLQIWEGYTGAESTAFKHLLSVWNKAHPNEQVSYLFVNNDNSLPKLLTAVKGGSQPDIAYVYGSWAPNVAQIPQVVNLTEVVQRPGVNWSDFWVGERDAATVNGKVIGVPALVDNLAVVYNKTLFAQAGLQPPAPNWTWSQFVADAQKLTNAAKKQFGTAYVTPGTEDTVWHWEALLWEAGGQILNSANTKAAFDSPAGLESLTALHTMSVTDKSMYLDPSDSQYTNLFNSGKIGMLVTGPWDLSSFPNVHYGVQIMPTFAGAAGGHQTISGPDNWVVFNNGSQRVAAAEQFLLWMTAAPQATYFSLHTGNLPIRQSVQNSPGFLQQMNQALPSVDTFVTNLGNVQQARPQIASYPKVSTILGNMVVSVLLGKSQPQAALTAAAAQVNAALAGGSGS